METFASLASGWSGGLPGTGRPSVSLSSATGQAFSQELERAHEEQEGTGLEAVRRAEARSTRRTERRASFGAEAADEPRPRADREAEQRTPAELPGGFASHAEKPPPPAPEGSSASAALQSVPEDAQHPANAAPEAVPGVSTPPAAATTLSSSGTAVQVAQVASERTALPVAPASAPTVEPAPIVSSPSRASLARPAAPGASPEVPGQAVLARAEEVLRQVQLHLAAGVKRLTLELEPEDLGRLSIQLALRNGKVAAIVRGERAETLELLRTREEDLRRMLAERGIVTDGVRFELGFRQPSEARHTRPSTSSGPGRAPRTAEGPASLDTYV